MRAATDPGFAARQIGEIAAALPGATAVFRRRELDFCYGGAVRCGHPDAPRGLANLRARIAWEMGDHMQKEEQGLCPMLRVGHGSAVAMELMRDEHDDHVAPLREPEALTRGHEPPADACNSWRALYAGTAQFAEDLAQHIHLENNALFARFVA